MINLCLLYTTYHSYLWDKIQKTQPAPPGTLIFNFSKRKINEQGNSIVKVDRSRDSKLKVLQESIKIATICKFNKFKLMLPHPDHLLGNTLFFNKNAESITWIEDGILNYYTSEKLDNGVLKKQRKRQLLTLLTPFRYKKYSGHLSGINCAPTKEIAGWFHEPELIVEKTLFKKTYKIPQSELSQQAKNGKLAILIEQPIEKFLNPVLADKIRQKAKTFLESNYEKVIVKKHPEHINAKKTSIQNETDYKINPHLPIEEQIELINPSDAISFCSTALINIKRSSKQIRCIAIGINEIIDDNPTLEGLKKLFEDSGVEIH